MKLGETPACRMRIKDAALTVLLGAAVLLGGCHKASPGANGTPATTAGIDPCTLVTRVDAERLLGARVAPALHSDSGPMATGRDCVYVTSAPVGSSGGTWGIGLTVYDDATLHSRDSALTSAAEYFHRSMKTLRSSGTTLVVVPGLGAAAFWQPSTNLLYLLDHGVYVVLDVDVEYRAAPGSSKAGSARLQADKRKAEIRLARDAILPRLADPASLSVSHRPHGGAGRSSS